MSPVDSGPLVGPYRIAERLGEGGMGEVRRAVDMQLEREVALKTLRPEMAGRADIVERFRVEAIALARLHHRHIAAVYAFFHDAGQYHIAMQFVRGRTLEAVLQQRGRLPWREAAAIASDVLLALDHAHALGVVHRDLKPANLMIDGEGRAVVMDFGIARVLTRGRQTRSGTLVGTLEYLAPEVVRGGDVDARSDLYSLGCVLYEMVTGELPFAAPSDFDLMRAHAEQAPPRPAARAGDLPPALEALILRALEKRPQQRFASARAFLEALARAGGQAPSSLPASHYPLTDRLAGALQPLHQALHRVHAWLALPTLRDGPAWRGWLRANPGLASAGAVAASALAVGIGLAAQSMCCRSPQPLPIEPLRAQVLAPVEPAAAPAPPFAPAPAIPPEPAPLAGTVPWPAPTGARELPVRADRRAGPDPVPPAGTRRPAPAAPRGDNPPPPAKGWYVQR